MRHLSLYCSHSFTLMSLATESLKEPNLTTGHLRMEPAPMLFTKLVCECSPQSAFGGSATTVNIEPRVAPYNLYMYNQWHS